MKPIFVISFVLGFSTFVRPAKGSDLENLKKIVTLQQSLLANLVPTGTVISFAGKEAPNGWLRAQGQEIQAMTFPRLFQAIGQTYCTADHGGACQAGSFRLPDLRGRTVAGLETNTNRLKSIMDSAVIGGTTGEAKGEVNVTVTQQPEFTNPAYSYAGFTKMVTNGELNYQIGGYYSYGEVTQHRAAAPGIDFAVSLGHSHGFTVNLPERNLPRTKDIATRASSFSNMQPTAILSYLIKAD